MNWRIASVVVFEDGDFGVDLVSASDEYDVAAAVVSAGRAAACERADPPVRVWSCEAATAAQRVSARAWLEDDRNREAIVSACEQGSDYRRLAS